jgi:NADPH2:quinone reductase
MRVVWLREFGPPRGLVAGDAPDPVAGPGQVLVDVSFVSVTFADVMLRRGTPPGGAPPPLPMIPGNGVGGIVSAAGPGVPATLIGQRVVTTTGGSGGYAERVAVAPGELIAVPDPVALADATALLADGRTAVGLVMLAEPEPEEWVLVEAAGGGLGSLLVQLARATGARVVAGASSEAKRALAHDLGAEHTVDYTRAGWTDEIRDRTGGAGLDVVFDGVGGVIGSAAADALAEGGRFVVLGMASGAMTDFGSLRLPTGARVIGLPQFGSLPLTHNQLTAAALAEAAAGRLRPVVGQVFALDQAAAAHSAIEARTTNGKTLLTP